MNNLTARTKTLGDIQVTYNFVEGLDSIVPQFIATTEKGTTLTSLKQLNSKGILDSKGDYYIEVIDLSKVLNTKGRGSVKVINSKEEVELFVKQAKEEANQKTEKIIKETLENINSNDIITIKSNATSLNFISRILINGENLNKFASDRIVSEIEKLSKSFKNEMTWSELQSLINEEEKQLQGKIEEAKRTNTSVVLERTMLPESLTPLAKDEENDIVECIKSVMPDGTIKEEYNHTY